MEIRMIESMERSNNRTKYPFLDKIESKLLDVLNNENEINPIFKESISELKEEDFKLYKDGIDSNYERYSLKDKGKSKKEYIEDQISSCIVFMVEKLIKRYSRQFTYKNKTINVRLVNIGDSFTICKTDKIKDETEDIIITPKLYSIGVTYNPIDIYNGDVEQFQDLITKIFKSFVLAQYKLIDTIDSDCIYLVVENTCHIQIKSENEFIVLNSFDAI